MTANARGWQRLLPLPQRPVMRVVTFATWLRESVNGLLPVARIGGEIVAYRVVRRHVAQREDAAASLVVDMGLSVFTQAAFALFGLALLLASGRTSTTASQLLWGIGAAVGLGAAFVIAQHAGTLGALTGALNQLFAGRLGVVHQRSLRFDEALRGIYRRQKDLVACCAWQVLGWMLGAGELWLALHFLGQPRGVLDALVLEALIQAVSSAAFVVPAALGVQEAAFLVVGAMLGIDGTTALALASARRLRDIVIFLPGLVAWHFSETQLRTDEMTSPSPPGER
jgi:putative membrane protein